MDPFLLTTENEQLDISHMSTYSTVRRTDRTGTVLLKSKVPQKRQMTQKKSISPRALQNKAQNQKSAKLRRCSFLLPIDSYIWGGI